MEKNQHIPVVFQTRKNQELRNPIWELPFDTSLKLSKHNLAFLLRALHACKTLPHANEMISTGKPRLKHPKLDQAYCIPRDASHEVVSTN